MTTSGISRLWNYIGECVRLLYWAFFKPFTLDNWLKELDPKQEPFTPSRKPIFSTNPRRHQYAVQSWWLSAVIPLLSLLLAVFIQDFFIQKPVSLLPSELFLIGWLIGLSLTRRGNQSLEKILTKLLWLATGGILLIAISFTCFYPIMLKFYKFVISLIFHSSFDQLLLLIILGILISTGVGFLLSASLTSTTNVSLGLVFSVSLGLGINIALCSFDNIIISILLLLFILNLAFVVLIDSLGSDIFFFSSFLVFLMNVSICSLVVEYQKINNELEVLTVCILLMIISQLKLFLWIPEFLWMLIVFVLTRKQKKNKFLIYLPFYFDEIILLPLPFLERIILEAYRENPERAYQTLKHLMTSTNQRKVASQTITAIVLDVFYQCRTLSDIIAVSKKLRINLFLNQLDNDLFSPPSLLNKLNSVLPEFLEISESIKSAEIATTSYRKVELLSIPINSLQRLRDKLIFGNDFYLAKNLMNISERWLSILKSTQNILKEQASQSTEIPLVYIAGSALDPETATNRFKGRIDIFRQIENLALATQPPVLLLYGGRRAGKTSALKYLPYKVGSELVPLLVDLQGVADATKLHSVALSLATQITHAAQKARNLRLPTPDPYSFQDDPFPALREWFSQVERTAPNKRFLLCLDEFERLSEVVESTGSRAPLNFLRHILQHRQQWILLFSGSHTLDELEPYWSDYLINTQSLRVSYLHQTEAQELIVEPVPDFPQIYEPEAVQAILSLTRCHPYLVQLTCYVLVEFLNRKAKANQTSALTLTATASDVHTIIPQVIETGGMYFRELWTTTLTSQERLLISQILADHLPAASDQALVKKLVQKEVLERDGKTFQVPLVQRYFEQVVQV